MPTQLFKYCSSKGGLKVLSKPALKATPPNEFNDPFEFSPVVKNKDPEGDALRLAQETINNPHYFEVLRNMFPQFKTRREFQEHARAMLPVLVSKVRAETGGLDEKLRNEINALSEKYGVICFSSEPLLLLMWAHYAEAHTGLVLEFDPAALIFRSPLFFKVEYRKERAEFDTSLPPSRSTILDFTTRKSTEWAYEKEYRLIVDLRKTTPVQDESKTLHLLPVPPGLFKSVTLGLRIDNQSRDAILSLAEGPPWKHLEVFQAEADSTEFMLRRQKLK